MVAASAEPDKLSLGGVSESRPLTISCCSGRFLDVVLDKLWPAHHLQLSGRDNQKDKERKSVMIHVPQVTTP